MIFIGYEGENLADEQEDEFSSGDESIPNEKPSGENLTNCFENNEAKLVSSDSGRIRNFHEEAQDVRGEDIVEFEREVEDMMQRMKEVQRKMSEEGVEGGGGEGRKAAREEEEVKASMEAIEKMEATLRAKAGEERRATLCRMEAEEETRGILVGLPCVKTSNGVRTNLQEFMRLLDDWKGAEAGVLSLEKVKEGGVGEEKKKKERGEEEKKKREKGKESKSLKFVAKNIELAKCGRGTLSLTEEEKRRIETLLGEAEDSLEQPQPLPGLSGALYAIDEEARSVLRRIEQELKAVEKGEGEGGEEKVDEKDERGEAVEKKRRSRLAEINKLLSEMKSVSEEEIIPLGEEEMANLVEQSKRSLGGESSCPGRDAVSELVTSAKLLMPKFKYRFSDG